AVYDMAIDHAVAVNRTMRLSPDVFYFACPCDTSIRQPDGTYKMDEDKTEKAFVTTGNQMGRLNPGVTRGGVVIDLSWRQNDGLVNTVAAGAPLGQPAREASLDEPAFPAGVWNVFPPYHGDHMSHMGGMLRRNKDVDRYYNELLSILARTD
ncbi:MAG: hypothetical protein J6T14_01870, partial [Clostridia bacterium]|nr:hypothetical protein [Clostridia bacterium]